MVVIRRRAHGRDIVESICRRGGGSEPRDELLDPQYSQAYQPQTPLQGTLGDLNSPAVFKVLLIIAANKVQAPAKTSDALALP